jgi:hypothetical protein
MSAYIFQFEVAGFDRPLTSSTSGSLLIISSVADLLHFMVSSKKRPRSSPIKISSSGTCSRTMRFQLRNS